jgi:HK97 family phage major capsid protein
MTIHAIPIETRSEGDDPIAAMTGAVDELRTGFETFRTSTDQRLTTELRGLADRLGAIETRMNRPNPGNPGNPDAEIERRSFLNFVRRGVERMDAEEVRALTVANDASAGYLAPEAYGAEIIKALVEFSPIRQYARVVSVSAPSIKYPRRLTGPTATWTEESATSTETTPSYEQVSLTPYELRTFIDVSNALLEDNAYSLESELVADLAEAFGVTEGAAFVTGDGDGKPVGLLNAAGLAQVTTGNAATLGTAPADTIIGMYHALPNTHAQRGVWLMNRTTLGTLRQVKDDTGRYLLVDPVSASAPMTLLGRPIVEAVDMPDIAANAVPIVFGDLQGYRVIDRVSFSLLRDPYSQAAKGQVRLHARRRVGGDVTHTDRFIKLKVSA